MALKLLAVNSIARARAATHAKPSHVCFNVSADRIWALISGDAASQPSDGATPALRADRRDDVIVLTIGRLVSPETLNPLLERELLAAGPAGIVLDLRGNTGGVLALAAGVAGYFVELDTPLGEVRQAGSSIPLIAHSRAVRTSARLAVVIDAHTASAAEILAAGLQASGRARRVRYHQLSRRRLAGGR